MSLILKLSKCRLCLKLGDFYSIFAVDNSIQLSQMAMACSEIKVQEGDGLPDKICGECIEKLSSAFIFKQQCERSDLELRRSLPGSSGPGDISSYGRRNSDSGFSNRTDVSSSRKDISNVRAKIRKKENGSEAPSNTFGTNDGLLEECYSIEISDPSYERHGSNMDSFNNQKSDSDSSYHEKDDDADHDTEDNSSQSGNRDTPTKEEISQDTGKFNCPKCGKNFKYNIMLNRHIKVCNESAKEPEHKKRSFPLLNNSLKCPVCGKVYKKRIYIKKHMKRSICGEIAREFPDAKDNNMVNNMKQYETNIPIMNMPISNPFHKQNPVECSNCDLKFTTHLNMFRHFQTCLMQNPPGIIQCKSCKISYTQKASLYRHIKRAHCQPDGQAAEEDSMDGEETSEAMGSADNSLKCSECNKTFDDQAQLVMHLAAHMANINDEQKTEKTIKYNGKEYSCVDCTKCFKYKNNLRVHLRDDHNYSQEEILQLEASLLTFKCSICFRGFQFKKSLVHHTASKHSHETSAPLRYNTSPLTKPIQFTKCPAKCLKCMVMLRDFVEIKAHNRQHMLQNEKVKNEYACPGCELSFTNVRFFRAHLSDHNAQIREMDCKEGIMEAANVEEEDEDENYEGPIGFCEAVVENIKSEPMDEETILPNPGVVMGQQLTVSLGGFDCSLCGKTMSSLKTYRFHMNWHSKNQHLAMKKLACPLCDEKFSYDTHLKQHLKKHSNDTTMDPERLTCRICNRRSKNLRGLICHMNWHKQAAVREFHCGVCKKVFVNRGNYTMHYRQHLRNGETNRVVETFDDTNAYMKDTQITPYQCSICEKYMPTQTSLKYHTVWHNSSGAYATKYECNKCDKVFTNKHRHMMHMRIHDDGKSGAFKCHICHKYMKSTAHLGAHIKSHSMGLRMKQKMKLNPLFKLKPKKVTCPVCDKSFSYAELANHIKEEHPESKMVKKSDPDGNYLPVKHICTLCCKEFSNEARLNKHRAAHERKPKFFECTICQKRTSSVKHHKFHLKGHMYQKFKDDPLKCEHCEEKFIRRYELHLHLFRVHNINESYLTIVEPRVGEKASSDELQTFQCHLCRKVLATETTFQKHIDYHNTLRCNYCFKHFPKLHFLEAHVLYDCERKKVLGACDQFEKKIKCHICYKPFSIMLKLHCHMKVQHNTEPKIITSSGQKQAVCDFCFSVFPSEEYMEKHKKQHLRFTGFFGCKLCPKKFPTLLYFQRHKKKHLYKLHTEDPLKCEFCDEKFIAAGVYIAHYKEAHNTEPDWLIKPKPSPVQECHICKKSFSHINNHLTYHEKYKCKKCLEYFFSESLFDAHPCPVESDGETDTPKKHDEFANFPNERDSSEECDFCFKFYTSNYSKAMHITSHTKNVSFGCRYCDKTFSAISTFNAHALSHKTRHYKDNPLRCRHCGEVFIKYGNYMRHLRTSHNDNESMILRPNYPPEECRICKRVFSNIHHHYRFHLQFRCQSCLKYILSEKLFNRHDCSNENEDPKLVIEYDEDISHLSIGSFDYTKDRHQASEADLNKIPYEKQRLIDRVELSRNVSNEEIYVNESELDDSVLTNTDLSSMPGSPDATASSRDMIVSIPDHVVFGSYIPNAETSFDNFTPIISSTVSLSSSTPMENSNTNNLIENNDSTNDEDDEPEEVIEAHESVFVNDSDSMTVDDIVDELEETLLKSNSDPLQPQVVEIKIELSEMDDT